MNCNDRIELQVPECIDIRMQTIANEGLMVRVVNSLNQIKYFPVESDYNGNFTLVISQGASFDESFDTSFDSYNVNTGSFINRFNQYIISVFYAGTNTRIPLKVNNVNHDEVILKVFHQIDCDLVLFNAY